jgi:hypothetical protein
MKQGIGITVISEPDDDGLYKYRISLSNEETFTSLDFWGYADNFRDFGNKLLAFPKNVKDIVTYELGKDEDNIVKWAYYLSFSVFCFEPSGRSAVKVVVDNHADVPYHHRNEFYIKSEPASLNKLGQQLKEWNPEHDKEFEWIPKLDS